MNEFIDYYSFITKYERSVNRRLNSILRGILCDNNETEVIRSNLRIRPKLIEILLKYSKLIKKNERTYTTLIVCHSVCILDYYLYLTDINDNENLNILIITVIYISMKYNDDHYQYNIGISTLLEIIDYTEDIVRDINIIKNKELDILTIIDWKLEFSTIFDYILLYYKYYNKYFAKKSMQNIKFECHKVLKCNECLRYYRESLSIAILIKCNILKIQNNEIYIGDTLLSQIHINKNLIKIINHIDIHEFN